MIAASLTLAVGFVNPLLLGGLALLAAPILIHWLSRRRYRELPWAATRFLLEAERRNRRRLRFEQWLLVALRCAALGLLALLFARPFLQPGLVASLLGGRGEVQRIVVLDDSASLGFAAGNVSDFARLRAATTRLLSWLHQEAAGDPVTLLLTSEPDAPLVAGQRLSEADAGALQARVERLEVSALPARPRAAVAAVTEALARLGTAARADIYVLSDFQRSEWLATERGARSVFSELNTLEPDAVRVVLIASGSEPRDNVALVDLALERPQTIAGVPVVVRATVTNHGRRSATDLTLTATAGEFALPAVAIDPIAPGASRMVTFEAAFPDTGYSHLSASIQPGDGLRADDARGLATPVLPAVQVLLVNGQPHADPLRDEVHALRNALAPPGPFSSGVRADVIDHEMLETTSLDDYACVMLCNVPTPSAAAAESLRRYVHAGGGLGVFVGDQVMAEEYNRVLGVAHGGSAGEAPGARDVEVHTAERRAGLLPLELGDAVRRAGEGRGVGMVRDQEHPITAAFGGEAGLGESVRFFGYLRTIEGEGEFASSILLPEETGQRPVPQVLARFTDVEQTPALIEIAIGEGRVLLFTSTIDADWNDWPRAPDGSYVVTMLEIAQHLSRRAGGRSEFTAGETLTLSVQPDAYETAALIRSPAFPREPAESTRLLAGEPRVGEPVVLEGPRAMRLGVYTAEIRRRGGEPETRPLVVNPDPIESDLAVARESELDAALGAIPHEYVASAEAFLLSAEQSRREVWPALLVLVVLLLMGEQALACWFGSERGWRRATGIQGHRE